MLVKCSKCGYIEPSGDAAERVVADKKGYVAPCLKCDNQIFLRIKGPRHIRYENDVAVHLK